MVDRKHIRCSLLVLLVFISINLLGQEKSEAGERRFGQLYEEAFHEMELMLLDSIKPDFKRAVFITENAYADGHYSYEGFTKLIGSYAEIIKVYMKANPLPYREADRVNVSTNYAIYQFMCDTIWLTEDTVLHYPYSYNFEDYAGENSWQSTFVSTLLLTGKGNCHSMPFLYKILAQELGAEAYLSLAPYHMYIKTRSEKTGWYNTELTNGMFPVDAWVAASGYVTLDAMKSGIYMDTLSQKQSIAFCLYDLAKGCERKYGFGQFPFIFDCLDLALQYYPNFINAQLFKAECLKKRLDAMLVLYGVTDYNDMMQYEKPREIFDEMEALYVKILDEGFREMPPGMYHEWMMSLKDNKEKYQNNQLFNILQSK